MIEKCDLADFESVYIIMESSFPINEIRSRHGQYELLKKENYSLYIKKEQGKIIGFISVWDLGDFNFIEHFAIDKNYRNKGVGSKMLKQVIDSSKKKVVLEVEPIINETTKKRVDFYTSNGMFYHDFYYEQPALEKERERVELKIMSTTLLTEQDFNKVKEILYKKVYKV